MARKPNYDFERRKKEMDRKNKKEAKKEERARRKAAGLPEEGEEGFVEGGEGEDVNEDDTTAES